MESWVNEKEHHVAFFERKVQALGLPIEKTKAEGCYQDPTVEQLWAFYRLGVEQENQEWQKDYC
jgi:hypothetical protein